MNGFYFICILQSPWQHDKIKKELKNFEMYFWCSVKVPDFLVFIQSINFDFAEITENSFEFYHVIAHFVGNFIRNLKHFWFGKFFSEDLNSECSTLKKRGKLRFFCMEKINFPQN